MRFDVRSAAGSSLREALIGMALVAVVASSMGNLMLTALSTSETAPDLREQTVAASREMERMLLVAFTSDDLRAGGSLTSSIAGYSIDPLDGDADRYVRWQVLDEGADFKRITVVAGVRNPDIGTSREVRVETFRQRSE